MSDFFNDSVAQLVEHLFCKQDITSSIPVRVSNKPICFIPHFNEWGCVSVASNELNINRGGIENCSLGKSKSSGGFIWRYNKFDKIEEICVEKSGRKKGSIPWNKKKIVVSLYRIT